MKCTNSRKAKIIEIDSRRNRKSERYITGEEIELVMKNLTTKKIPETDDFTGELYQMFKEDSISIIHKFFKQTEEEETFLKLTL